MFFKAMYLVGRLRPKQEAQHTRRASNVNGNALSTSWDNLVSIQFNESVHLKGHTQTQDTRAQ